jgi:hypothetical protein
MSLKNEHGFDRCFPSHGRPTDNPRRWRRGQEHGNNDSQITISLANIQAEVEVSAI